MNTTSLNANTLLMVEMKLLLHHASRSFFPHSASRASPARCFGDLVSRTPSLFLGGACKAPYIKSRRADIAQWGCRRPATWSSRSFWSSKRNLDDGKPPQSDGPNPMRTPSQPIESGPAQQFKDPRSESLSSIDSQKRSIGEVDSSLGTPEAAERVQALSEEPLNARAQERRQEIKTSHIDNKEVVDNINRVPDEHLPSHRERQRWSLSKRFSEFMDELLPKLAVVTQKVNTYTGTDYSGVEGLRREIQEQGIQFPTKFQRIVSNIEQRTSLKPAAVP